MMIGQVVTEEMQVQNVKDRHSDRMSDGQMTELFAISPALPTGNGGDNKHAVAYEHQHL